MEQLPVCYFPTTTLLVDDNLSFLQNIAFELGDEDTVFKLFDRPQNALAYFMEQYQPHDFLQHSVVPVEEDELDQRQLQINIKNIHQEIYHAKRFAQVSTMVVDQTMPGLSGGELAEKIKHLPINIILLTGDASHELATNLFNKGVIQHFIRKDALNASEQLKTAINQLQINYFSQLSKVIIDSILQKTERFGYPPPSCLNDPVFIAYFYSVIHKHNIIEYYLLEESGSFLLATPEGKLCWLLVKHEGDMEALDDEIKLSSSHLAPTLVEKIKHRDVLFHAFNQESITETTIDWQHCLYPTTKINGKSTTYYCSYVENPYIMPDDIASKKIISYNKYLQTL